MGGSTVTCLGGAEESEVSEVRTQILTLPATITSRKVGHRNDSMSDRNSQRDDRMEEDNCSPPQYPDNWVYAEQVDLIIHMPGTCPQCNEFVSHSMLGSLSNLWLYRTARDDRAHRVNAQVSHAEDAIEGYRREIVDLRRQLRSTREELDHAYGELNRERSRFPAGSSTTPPRSSPYDERQHNTETRRRVNQVREERNIRSSSAAVQAPAPPSTIVTRAHPPSSSSTRAESSAQRDSIAPSSNAPPQGRTQFFFTPAQRGVVPFPRNAPPAGESRTPAVSDRPSRPFGGNDDSDDDDDLPLGERPDVVVGVASSNVGLRWRRWLDTNGAGEDPTRIQELEPATVEQFMFLDQLMRERQSHALARYLGTFRSNAQSTKKERRSEAQAKACASWKKPDWAPSTVFNRQTMQVERGTVSEVRAGTEDQRQAKAARLQDEIMSVAFGLGLVINNAPHPHLGSPTNPRHGDHPAIWQSHFRNHWGHQRPLPQGLDRASPQTPVQENLLCAYHRLSQLTSQMETLLRQNPSGTIAEFRIRMFRMLIINGEYRRLITAQSIRIAPNPAYQLGELPPFVLSDEIVAETLAGMGFTFAEADAAWLYARNWVRQLDEDELPRMLRPLYVEAMTILGNPSAPVPRHLHALDAAPFVWDDTSKRWRIDPVALDAANCALMGVWRAQGPSTSLASIGAAAPETTTTTAPVEPVSGPTRATVEVSPAVQEQLPDATMNGNEEPGEITVAIHDHNMDALGEERQQAMDQA